MKEKNNKKKSQANPAINSGQQIRHMTQDMKLE